VWFQLHEFERALVGRDDIIRSLSANLRTMTENRDSLQAEYMTQASQLVEQVQILQDQLKQVAFFHRSLLPSTNGCSVRKCVFCLAHKVVPL